MSIFEYFLIDCFFDVLWLEKGFVDNICEVYCNDFQQFNVWFDGCGLCLEGIGCDVIFDYLVWCLEQGYKVCLIVCFFFGLCGFYCYCLCDGLIVEDFILQVDLL